MRSDSAKGVGKGPPALHITTARFLTTLSTRINVCDLPDKFDKLTEDCRGGLFARRSMVAADSYGVGKGVTVMRDGHLVSRQSDFIIYSVEAEFMDRVVAQYGPCTSSRIARIVIIADC